LKTNSTLFGRQPAYYAGQEDALSLETDTTSRAAQRAFVLYLPALLVLAGAAYAGTITRDGDIYFHLPAGRWILEHLQFIHRDIFSYTVAGTRWDDPEWLSEIVMAIAYRLAGWSGVALVCASAAALTFLLLARQLLRHMTPLQALIVMQFVLAIIASGLSSRPYVLGLPLLVAWTDGLLQAREDNRSPSLWLLPLMALWSNLHGSFLFGIALLAPFAAEAFFANSRERLQTASAWAFFIAGSILAAMINPNGVFGLIDSIQFTLSPVLNTIGDWQSSSFTQLGGFELALFGLFALSFSRPVKLPLFRLLLLLLLVHMTLVHRRHANVFAIVAPMILAKPIAMAFARGRPPSRLVFGAVPKVAAIAASLVALVVLAVRLAVPNHLEESWISPERALAHVPPALAKQHVFNSDGVGGFLISRGIRPFIDTRVELYGAVFPDFYVKIFAPDRSWLESILTKHNVMWTMFPPKSPINARLAELPGWRKLYADKFTVVFVRKDAGVIVDSERPAETVQIPTNVPVQTKRRASAQKVE
jgi:hypothetical protein